MFIINSVKGSRFWIVSDVEPYTKKFNRTAEPSKVVWQNCTFYWTVIDCLLVAWINNQSGCRGAEFSLICASFILVCISLYLTCSFSSVSFPLEERYTNTIRGASLSVNTVRMSVKSTDRQVAGMYFTCLCVIAVAFECRRVSVSVCVCVCVLFERVGWNKREVTGEREERE